MPYGVSGVLGADLNNVITAADRALSGGNGKAAAAKLGQLSWGDDGKQYVYAQANASIPASTAVCTVSPTTFLVTASGGAYSSPAFAMVSGDQAWFGKAAV